jgi:hypothetical protein
VRKPCRFEPFAHVGPDAEILDLSPSDFAEGFGTENQNTTKD